jgi:hypothetical protein
VSLGQVLTAGEAQALATRADELALGRVTNPAVQMQMDHGGAYEEVTPAVDRFEQPTLSYRRIQGLEHDAPFRRVLDRPLVRQVCDRVYGAHTDISIFRAIVMNKPAGLGTVLPWHQDAGDIWGLDRDPTVTLWLALDDSTRENGCVEVVPGTHRLGVLTDRGSTLSPEHVATYCPPEEVRHMEAAAGEMFLLHNWVLHRSGVNPTGRPRRAFTTCVMDARTISTSTGNRFSYLFGEPPREPYQFVRQMQIDLAFLRDAHARAEEYAHSLEAEVERLRAALDASHSGVGH